MSVLQAQPIDGRFDAQTDRVHRDDTDSLTPHGHLYVVPDTSAPRSIRPRAIRPQASAEVRTARPPKVRPASAETPALSGRGILSTAVGIILAISIGALGGWLAQPAPYSGETTVTSVAAGESLWTIASGLGIEGRPIDEIVNDIRQLNHLESSHLDIGQPLVVPVQ